MSLTPPEIPQALQTGYASRLRLGGTSMMVSMLPAPRKRGVSYADFADEIDDDEDDPSFGREVTPSRYSRHHHLHDSRQPKVETKRLAVPTRPVLYTPEQEAELVNAEESLVPIRLDFEVGEYRVQDFFLWDARDPGLSPEQFAILTCQELELSVGYTSNIANAVKQQLAEYAELASIKIPEDADLHVVVNLSLNLGKELFEDKFEWDLGSRHIAPLDVARQIVADLGLRREFVPAITHALHEQILRMKRAIFVDGRLIDVVNEVAPHARLREAGVRQHNDLIDDWSPALEVLSQSDLDRREMERERMMRRMKRDAARHMMELDVGSMMSRKRRKHVEF